MNATSMDRKILVVGATGKQGRALISSLQLPSHTSEAKSGFQILALTRNPSSASALSLKASPKVRLVRGDLEEPQSIRNVFENEGGKASIWGMFVVLPFRGFGASAEGEAKQGIKLVEFALEYKVAHFVFSSVEHRGESHDEQLDPDRTAKIQIERHIKWSGAQGLRWTILRPTFFMENLSGSVGSIAYTALRCGLQPDVKIEMAAVDDIGRMAAAAFKDPLFSTRRIFVVTSDILTPSEIDAVHLRATGKHMPSIPNFLGRIILDMNTGLKGLIYDLERVHQARMSDPNGYDAHLADSTAFLPETTSFETWARRRRNSRYYANDKGNPNWNNVSVWKLITGQL